VERDSRKFAARGLCEGSPGTVDPHNNNRDNVRKNQ